MWVLLVYACVDGEPDAACTKATWLVDADGDGVGGTEVVACDAPEGVADEGGDCDDADAGIFPGAAEACDGLDQDCDGEIDEGVLVPWYSDADGDGWGGTESTSCGVPAGAVTEPGDCDDGDAAIHPGVEETCDGVDQDCDGETDEGADDFTFYADVDGDGAGDPTSIAVGCTAPDGYVPLGDDCDDTDATVHPGAEEVCDGVDDDCDGAVDTDATDRQPWFEDADGDAYGNSAVYVVSCDAPVDYVGIDGDCDDGDPALNPGATDEPGDSIDQDCDGDFACFADDDDDNYGVAGATVDSGSRLCAGANVARVSGDCDDTDAASHPGAAEVAYDGIDQDCDGTDLLDVDGDGFAAATSGGDDCDDTDGSVHPGAAELCDEVDDDCDGLVDAADPDTVGSSTWYSDADGDGFGDDTTATPSACRPDGAVDLGGDCDDGDDAVNPLADEACDTTVDQNCDGSVGAVDADGDGSVACEDCDDTDPAVHPGATEVAGNLQDDDCDGLLDEYVGDVTIASLTAASTFCASYRSVEGDLTVRDVPRLTDLECLQAVSGSLRFDDVQASSFVGLEELTTVGADLLVGGWDADGGSLSSSNFVSLDGLDRLHSVGGDLWLDHNGISDFAGVPRLSTVGGSLVLRSVPFVDVTVPLTTLGDDLWLESLTALASVSSGALTSFGGSLWMQDLGDDSGGYTLDWGLDIPGALALESLPDGANLAWTLPDHAGALYVEDCDLTDLTGLETLQTVDGDVVIDSAPYLGSLDGLVSLTSVGGSFGVDDATALPADLGLPALVSVGGYVRLTGLSTSTLAGFPALTTVGEGIELRDDRSLTTVTAFGAVESCPDLELTRLLALTDASGLDGIPFSRDVTLTTDSALPDLTFLSGVHALSGQLVVNDLPKLVSLDGLQNLTTVGAAFTLYAADVLSDATALANLEDVGGAMTLSALPALTTLNLRRLTTVGGDLVVDDLDGLPDLGGWSALTHAGGLLVSDMDLLVDLDGLDALTTVDGSVYLEQDDALVHLDGLDALTEIGVDLRLRYDDALVDLSGLGALQRIGQDLELRADPALAEPVDLGALTSIERDLWVEDSGLVDFEGMGSFTLGNTLYLYEDDALSSLDGLDALTTIPHHLVLADLPTLISLGGLRNVTSVGEDVRIGACDHLETLDGLDALGTIGGDLEIGEQYGWPGWGGRDDALVSLDGLGALTTVGGSFKIGEDPLLADVSALDALTSVGGDLWFVDLPSLATADAEGYADGTPVVGGTVYVYGLK